MRDDPYVIGLVARATAGDQGAWNEIVERYTALVWGICRRYGLDRQDSDDVRQAIWLALVENIRTLREPAALAGWIATTAQNACRHVLREARRHDHAELPPADQMPPYLDAVTMEEMIVAAERVAGLCAAYAELRRPYRELLAMLMCDPPRSYADISAALGLAVGSIGSMRARCLEELRRSPHIAAIAEGGAPGPARDRRGDRDE
jgi:RNA polymerase sigma factor (sigma-70 family)